MNLESPLWRRCYLHLRWYFQAIFWEKMVSDGQTVHFWPHCVIHNRKAVHPTNQKLWWEVSFWHPMKCQNFSDAPGQILYLYLILCLKSQELILTLIDFYWFWLIFIDPDWWWLILIDSDWCWLIFIDSDWWWLVLIDSDRCWLILRYARECQSASVICLDDSLVPRLIDFLKVG